MFYTVLLVYSVQLQICQVVIGEAAGQGMRVVSKCLWDTNVDNWASFSYKTPTLFAVGMVFGEMLDVL